MVTAQLAQRSLFERPIWQPEEPTDPDARAVLHVLHDGQRWSRPQLMVETGRSDRAVRAGIELLRRSGFPVVSSSSESGYRLTWTDADALDRLEADLGSRALAALKTRSAIRKSRARRAT